MPHVVAVKKWLVRAAGTLGVFAASLCNVAWGETIDVASSSDLQTAINDAAEGDIIRIRASALTYSVNVVISGKSQLTIRGEETFNTRLKAKNKDVPTIRIEKSSIRIEIQNLTFVDAGTAIEVSDSSRITISANVFSVGTSGTGIAEKNSDTDVFNNTFYGNSIGTQRTSTFSIVKDNLFSENSTGISDTTSNVSGVSYNGFHNNTSDGNTGLYEVIVNQPLFVDVATLNFHLQPGSEAIATDSEGTSELGAYGGKYADKIPYPVRNLVQALQSDDGTNFSVAYSWDPNLDHRLSTSYWLSYFFEAFPAAAGTEGPIADTPGVPPALTLSGTLPTVTDPLAPEGVTSAPGNGKLLVHWNAVAGATRYSVHYGLNSTSENVIPDIKNTEVEIPGLQNGFTYRITVRAQSQAILHASVKAKTTDGTSSLFASNELTQTLGTEKESADSAEITAIPEATVPYPALPDEGCFIATAAYGYYSAPQVQQLRLFRDRYLMTNTPGRAFVGWYYRNSPPLAAYIRENQAARTVVRLALYPAVLMATFTTQYPWLTLVVSALLLVLAASIVKGHRNRITAT